VEYDEREDEFDIVSQQQPPLIQPDFELDEMAAMLTSFTGR